MSTFLNFPPATVFEYLLSITLNEGFGTFPWQVLVTVYNGSIYYICGGALVDRQHVVTVSFDSLEQYLIFWQIKVAFCQKALMHLSFPQSHELFYFLNLKI